jgi:hypothetical protein
MLMKKLLMTVLFAGVVALQSFGYIKVDSQKGGLFGYKYLKEEHNGKNHDLVCMNPGFSSCKWHILPPLTDARPISLDRYEQLLEYANEEIYVKGNYSGRMITEDRYVITWSHTEDEYRDIYTIYDLEEAKEMGII